MVFCLFQLNRKLDEFNRDMMQKVKKLRKRACLGSKQSLVQKTWVFLDFFSFLGVERKKGKKGKKGKKVEKKYQCFNAGENLIYNIRFQDSFLLNFLGVS